MLRIHKTMIATSLFVVASAVPAGARTLPGISAVATDSASSACFANYYSDKLNDNCPIATLQVPLVIDTAGTLPLTVTGKSNDMTKNMTCKIVAVDQLGGLALYVSAEGSLPAFGSYQNIPLTGYVPGWGAAYVECTLNQGVQLHEVQY
jgi:hypothetical protein